MELAWQTGLSGAASLSDVVLVLACPLLVKQALVKFVSCRIWAAVPWILTPQSCWLHRPVSFRSIAGVQAVQPGGVSSLKRVPEFPRRRASMPGRSMAKQPGRKPLANWLV